MCKSSLLTVVATISLAVVAVSQGPQKTGSFVPQPAHDKAAPAWFAPGPPVPPKPRIAERAPTPVPRTTARPAPNDFDPARVMYDDRGDGGLWAATGAYKVRFGAAAVTVVPYLGSDASRNWPVTFRLTRVAAGGQDLALDASAIVGRDGDAVDLDRGAVTDRWHLRSAEVEQTFVIGDLPRSGDVLVEVVFDTDLECRRVGRGFEFVGPDGGLRYGAAIAIDARGRRTELQSQLVGDRIVHRVPAAFVSGAALPIVVDPVISTFSSSAASRDFGSPDMAFEIASGRFLVVSERRWSVSDTDVWSELREADGQLVSGSGAWIDVSTDNWRKPQVASNNAANKFLVVAEARTVGSSWTAVRGRVRDALGSTTVQPVITISTAASNDAVDPDVGGDGNVNGPDYWAVVWGHRHSVTDTDVYYRMVGDDGSFTTPAAIVLENSTADDVRPRISKSNGRTDPNTQSWMVVFSREISPTTHRVVGAALAWDGRIVHQTFPIQATGGEFLGPDVSSPTEPIQGRRYHLVVSQMVVSSTDHDIWADLVVDGQWLRGSNLTGQRLDLQVRPSVDSDGCRFAIAYSHGHNVALNDYDIYAMTVHLQDLGQSSPNLGHTEDHVPVATASAWEGAPAIAATLEPAAGRYMIAYENANGSATSFVGGAIYEGLGGGGISRLPHGCHNFPITVTGEPRLGTRISFRVPGPVGGPSTSGTLFGLLRTPAIRLPMCSVPCELGVDGPAYPALIHVDIPCDGALLGAQAAVQGWDLLGGSCIAAGLRLSDTVVITVR